jgi:hypothetical protein
MGCMQTKPKKIKGSFKSETEMRRPQSNPPFQQAEKLPFEKVLPP